MNHPLLHAERVHEGLEHRAGRAPSVRAVDLAEDVVVEEIGRANDRAHTHVAGIDQHRGGVVDTETLFCLDESAHLPFQEPLQWQLERGPHRAFALSFGEYLIGEMGRKKRQVVGLRRYAKIKQPRVSGGWPGCKQAPTQGLAHAHELGCTRPRSQGLRALVRVLRQQRQ
jgi:hypothetical protein